MTHRFSQMMSTLCCVVLISNFVGCTTFHSPFGKRIPTATAADPVIQILCLWQQGEGRDPDGYPCKGFSGQILFLSSRTSTPVRVEGDVRIYLFDDQGTIEEQSKPYHQFNFDNGSWSVHLAETSLGPTYNVFVPYARRGITEADCSLRVRLKPKNGPLVFSDFSNIPLNGNKKPLKGEDAKPILSDEIERMAAEAMTTSLRRTTTISTEFDPKANEETGASKKEQNANPIQLASHEVSGEPSKESAEADRIRRLESMVQQLLEQKNAPVTSTSPRAQVGVAPAELDLEAINSSERLRLNHRIKIRREDDGTNSPPEPRRRPSHPLDDDQPNLRGARFEDEDVLEPSIGSPLESFDETRSEPRSSRDDQRYRRSSR